MTGKFLLEFGSKGLPNILVRSIQIY